MPIRILVADDEPEMLRLLSLLLERRNYETIPADSSVAALDLAFKDPPDAILLDLMMPDMDGLEVCRRLRADSRTSALPILAITARIGWGSRAEAVRAGVDDFVTKPFDADDLFSRIESALAGRESPGDRLVAEIMQTTLVTLGCHLIWLLAVNREEQALETAAIVSAPQEALARDLIQRLRGDASPDVPPERLYPRLPLAGGPFAELLRSGAIVYDLGRVSGAGVVTAALAAVGIKTVSAIPILTRGQPIGLLLYDNPAGAPRTESGRLAALAANIAAAALTTHGLIDDLRRSEESARAERAFRQMILDTMGDELIVLDAAGRVEFVNQRLLQHTGYADVELQGRPMSVLIGGWERGAAGLPARTMSLESRLKSKNGETRPMQIISAPRPAGGGTILVLTDLSQYKRIQAELEEQNRRLGALIQASRAMTSLLDLTEVPGRILEEAAGVMDAEGGAILLLDEAARGLTFAAATGPGAERVRGTTLPLNAGVAGWVARTGQAAMVDETEQDSRFYREVDAQTGLSTRSLLAVPLRSSGGVIGVLELLNKRGQPFDAADRSLLESLALSAVVAIQNARLYARLEASLKALAESQAQLVRAEKLAATGRLAATLAHEINNPLQSVRTALTLAARAEVLAEERQKYMALAQSETQRLAGLVQRMLEFHRTPQLDQGPVDLAAVLDRVLALAEPRLRQNQIEVVRDWSGTLPPVPGSADQLTQVFLNLVLNACDAMNAPGRITLRLSPAASGDRAIAEVTDTGPGIPPEARERLFEPFFTTKAAGTGLGLAVTLDIVERHGGKIEVESDGVPGAGTTFRISLPTRSQSAIPAASS